MKTSHNLGHSSRWRDFSDALIATALGQRVYLKADGSNCYATLSGGLAGQNLNAVNAALPDCADGENATQAERDEVNTVITNSGIDGINQLPPAA